MPDYWLISTPSDKKIDETWKKLNHSVGKIKGCAAFKFYIPVFKVGTLDNLLIDADSLAKLEMHLEGLLNRLFSSLANVLDLEHNLEAVREQLVVEGDSVHSYLINFKWDEAKFPSKQTIKCITDLAHKQASQIDADYKVKYNDYTSARNAYESAALNDQGSLLTRNLTEIVAPEDFISGSTFLCTILVVVPKKLILEWYSMYERFDETVVPRSSRIIFEDNEYYLCGVTIFKEGVTNFTENARRNKFVIREHIRENMQDQINKEKLRIMKEKKDQMFEPLVKLLKRYLCEIFKTSIHVKAAKLFVESVLRYGLPADFRAAVIIVNRKLARKVRDVLYNLYKHLDVTAVSDGGKSNQAEASAAVGHADYFPYVATKINADII